ncbi:MAG: hypothetical protein QXZ12_01955, partial [Thermoplasmata archaeon]
MHIMANLLKMSRSSEKLWKSWKWSVINMNYNSQRVVYGETLVELGEKYKKLVVLDADLSSSTQTT